MRTDTDTKSQIAPVFLTLRLWCLLDYGGYFSDLNLFEKNKKKKPKNKPRKYRKREEIYKHVNGDCLYVVGLWVFLFYFSYIV